MSESVQVHRLLTDEGVAQRLREILTTKKELFESFARESETAASAREAYDVTEAELARDIIAAERERLFGQPAPAAPAATSSESQAEDVSGELSHSQPSPSCRGQRNQHLSLIRRQRPVLALRDQRRHNGTLFDRARTGSPADRGAWLLNSNNRRCLRVLRCGRPVPGFRR
jgi:hypothetical protein